MALVFFVLTSFVYMHCVIVALYFVGEEEGGRVFFLNWTSKAKGAEKFPM